MRLLLDKTWLCLTYGDGVDLALDVQHAVVTLESINHLLQLGVADHQVLCSFLVLLHKTEEQKTERLKPDLTLTLF